jgi:hypothetical protein
MEQRLPTQTCPVNLPLQERNAFLHAAAGDAERILR